MDKAALKGALLPHDRRAMRFISKYRTKIYAGLGGLALSLLVVGALNLPFMVALLLVFAPVGLAFVLPRYVTLICAVEDDFNQRTALVTPARLVRFLFHVPIVFSVLAIAHAARGDAWAGWSVAFALTAGAAGLHAVAVTFAYRGYGDRISNSILAISAIIWLVVTAEGHWSLWVLTVFLGVLFGLDTARGLLSDLRSRLFPRRGIGVFFGSFNPVHKMHLALLSNLLADRQLNKIYVHATTIPKLHRVALARGEIAVCERAGVREYRASHFADTGKNYFPTGNWFYDYELRLELLKAAISDAGLNGRVEVLNLPDLYEKSGFAGVLRRIKSLHKGQPVHGLHGSDPGGMWVRNIFDSSGWIYPCPIVRTGVVSATAIRAGAIGLTSVTVERFLAAKRRGEDFVFPSGYVFRNR